ncbi:MAG: hypothetical protein BMS9Abin13_131 [Patescibacteria group bacterium]|nr:MAG: hypothetical protein BMS9Abin13_131 [Patescibacteria group bacterium]
MHKYIPSMFPKFYKKIVKWTILLFLCVVPASVLLAQGYIPLAPLPSVEASGGGGNLAEYFSALFAIGIGVAGVLAVLMLVVAGIEYIGGAGSESAKKDAKNRIKNALFGLLLALSSWVILYTLNPDLIGGTLNIPSVPPPALSPVPEVPPLSTLPSILPSSPNVLPAPISPPAPVTEFVLPPVVLSDPSNDLAILQDCLLRIAEGVCATSDLNSDGNIDIDDFTLFLESLKYDINSDGVIEFAGTSAVTSCVFKVNTEPITCNVGDLNNDDEIDSSDLDLFIVALRKISDPPITSCLFFNVDELIFSPYTPVFAVKCAPTNITFSIGEFNNFKKAINRSASGTRVQLDDLYRNLFFCDSDEGTCYFDSQPELKAITFSTIAVYDLNRDGVADLGKGGGNEDLAIFNSCLAQSPTGACAQADFNADGAINNADLTFRDFMHQSVFAATASPFIPLGFKLGGIEAMLFDSSEFSDIQIIEYCVAKKSIMNCAIADVNADGVIDSLDLGEFKSSAGRYDINGDGVVNVRTRD